MGRRRAHGRRLRLNPGDLLIFEEVRGSRSGRPADADPTRRHAVRLTDVTPAVDRLLDQPVLEVTWSQEDALPFPLTLSTLGKDRGLITDVSVAHGNVVPADHGRTVTAEPQTVPSAPPPDPCCGPPDFGYEHLSSPRPSRPKIVLDHVVQALPFPDPETVATAQATRLADIPEYVRRRLTELWRSARDGLSDEEIAELAVLFGLPYLERLELREHPARALRELLHREDRLLAGKRRRLEVLIARARAGTVLGGNIVWEIAQTWGERYAAGLDPADPILYGPATQKTDPRRALPAVRISDGEHVWDPRRDLLDSGPRDRHFVGELRDDGRLALRFGDGRYGATPRSGSRLELTYRTRGGTAGNVGAEAIRHLLSDVETPPITVRNPLPATGGTDPEPLEYVRHIAPLELRRRRLRAVTAEDYAALAAEVPGVQRAAAQIRWTGGTQEAHVAIDALGTGTPAPALLDAVTHALEQYRRIGHDLIVEPARAVPLDIALEACVVPGHEHGRIRAELYHVLGRMFRPDALTFGEPVRVSRLVAVAAAVPGVAGLRVTKLRRLFGEDNGELDEGVLCLGVLEIAQCDNDPDRPENGHLSIDVIGEAR